MRQTTRDLKRARRLRRALTPPELALWSQLKSRKLDGLHFRVQHGPERGEARDSWLAGQGIETRRIPAAEVRGDLSDSLWTILAAVRRRAPSVTS